MKFKEACSAVADLFEALPETWTTRSMARDEYGESVYAGDPMAVSWCAVGGVKAAVGRHDYAVWDNLNYYAVRLGYPNAAEANNFGGRLVAIKILRLAAGEI